MCSHEARLRWAMPGGHCQAFLLAQVDIERSYALVLHKLVRRVNGKLTHSLRQALDEQLSLDANCQFSPRAYCGSDQAVARLKPLTNMYQAQLAHMAGLLDVRVFRRVARELWNAAAGVSTDHCFQFWASPGVGMCIVQPCTVMLLMVSV